MCAGGIKSLLEVKKGSFISLLGNCFLIHCSFFLPLSLKGEIGGGGEEEGNVKIDEGYRGTICVSTCVRARPTKRDKVREK